MSIALPSEVISAEEYPLRMNEAISAAEQRLSIQAMVMTVDADTEPL